MWVSLPQALNQDLIWSICGIARKEPDIELKGKNRFPTKWLDKTRNEMNPECFLGRYYFNCKSKYHSQSSTLQNCQERNLEKFHVWNSIKYLPSEGCWYLIKSFLINVYLTKWIGTGFHSILDLRTFLGKNVWYTGMFFLATFGLLFHRSGGGFFLSRRITFIQPD